MQKAIELNQIIGSKSIVMASAGEVANADGWKAVADRLNAAAEKLKPLGMTTGYHNHAAEWKPVDGKRPMDILASSDQQGRRAAARRGHCARGRHRSRRVDQRRIQDGSRACTARTGAGGGYAVVFGEGDAPWPKIFEAAERPAASSTT